MSASKAVNYIKEAIDAAVNGEENKKKKQTATQEINELLDSLEADKLPEKPRLPDAPKYERMEYDAPTDEQLKERAQTELGEYKQSGEKRIDSEIEELGKKYNSDMERAKTRTDEAVGKTSDAYAAAKQNTDNDMLKRGLARSSIAANKRAQLESGEAAAKAALYDEYNRQVSELGDKISSLRTQREQAINDFNLAYATKLSDRINELVAERDKKVAEVLKYNNSLTEKEHSAQVDKQMKESDLYGEALAQKKKENELSGSEDSASAKAYYLIVEKLRGINHGDAREMVLYNPRIRAAVGNTYFYYRLYDEFCR